MIHAFKQRAQLYADWDRRLQAQTRFFAAAAVTNAVLADLLSRFCGRWYLSGATLESLAHLGLRLERLNLALAQRLLSRPKQLRRREISPGEDLDHTMVELEQHSVQRWLGGLLAHDRQRHQAMIRQVDGLLRIVGFRATPARLCRSGALYARVLRMVGGRLGRPASFAHQEDRICIGRALIRQVRGPGPEGSLSKQTLDRYHVRPFAAGDWAGVVPPDSGPLTPAARSFIDAGGCMTEQVRIDPGAPLAPDADTLILVDEADREIGHLSKDRCHDGRGVLHRAFSLLIFNEQNELLLQRRSAGKRLWPGYWSNSVCSHPRRSERMDTAIHRRLHEELGLRCPLHFLFKFQYQAQFESHGAEQELCSVFIGRCTGTVRADPNEVLEWRWVAAEQLQAEMAGPVSSRFTPWFIIEWQRVWQEHRPAVLALP